MKSIDTFGLVAAAPSLIVGLSISRLMLDGVTLFRSRNKIRIDWIPLVWALIIFLIQIQYLWAMIELHGVVRTWSIFDFILLLGISLGLYIAAALVIPDLELVPPADDLEKNFRKHGRWSLVALAFSEIFASSVDFIIFNEKISPTEMFLMTLNVGMPILVLFCSHRRARIAVTLISLLAVFWGVWLQSPKTY